MAFCLLFLFTGIIAVIRVQPFDDHTIRTILLPSDCSAPCFMGIQPGVTQISEVYTLLEANPWVGKISSHIYTGCCGIALDWWWNGKQPAALENGKNTVYFVFDPATGIQKVQNVAIHTQIAAGYAILDLGAWSKDDAGALQGLDHAYVEVFYPQQSVQVSTLVPCPLSRWRLWDAPMTMAFNRDSWNMSGMKQISEMC
ncbi:MAG: hypothetical protein ABI970_10910 [Chloroflexota bacterium]